MIHREFKIFKYNGKISYVLYRWSGQLRGDHKFTHGHRTLRLNWGCERPLSKKSLLLFGTYLGLIGKSLLNQYDFNLNPSGIYDVDVFYSNKQKIDLIKLLTKEHVGHSKL